MDALIAALIRKLASWVVGAPFFSKVLALVSVYDGRLDLDGDGKKDAILVELTNAGVLFGKRQFNRAIEFALILVERGKA